MRGAGQVLPETFQSMRSIPPPSYAQRIEVARAERRVDGEDPFPDPFLARRAEPGGGHRTVSTHAGTSAEAIAPTP